MFVQQEQQERRQIQQQQPMQHQFDSSINSAEQAPSYEDTSNIDPHFEVHQPSAVPTDASVLDGATAAISMHDFLRSIIAPDNSVGGFDLGSSRPGTWTPRGLMDYGIETSLELDDQDLSFLNNYNNHNPFGLYTPTIENPPSWRENVSAETASEAPLGAAAFQKAAVWRFRPLSDDNVAMEQHNLSLAEHEAHESPEMRVAVDRRVTSESLSYSMRDKILALVIRSCKPENISRSVASFPSLELLDSLLNYYLTLPTVRADTFLHLPTFRPSQARPELLAAMVAAGASAAPDASLRKIGFAIQEAVRIELPRVLEDDNTMIRDIQCLQCFLIQLQIGLWSGNSRKMEIAESFEQPLLTMVRRGGWFRKSLYEPIAPEPEDHGTVLEEKWLRWVMQESRKRFVFRLFIHDTQSSSALLINPLVSYAELALPIPESRTLWLVPSAEQWKQVYLNRSPNRIIKSPSLSDLLQNVDLLVEQAGLIDEGVGSLALLCGAWALIWEYRQLTSIISGQLIPWSSGNLVLTSRYQELARLLQCIRVSSVSSTNLFLEHLFMHLHMSLEEVHLFAGIEGLDEARRVYPSLQEWVKTSAARQAVWHAGQIIRAARQFPASCLVGAHAVALYQAGLAFWTYGVVSMAAEATPNSAHDFLVKNTQSDSNEAIAWLDEFDSNSVQRFIALNRGQAAIHWPGDDSAHPSFALLSDPSAIMGVLMDLFEKNHASVKSKPPWSTISSS
ncbi:hypothetical protein H2203_000743 [Taxawa tesnikishii (nom. ined.)]|nr:hypothetical protein H2203_000743 [Dothideales sp. JES 119]